MLAYGASVLQVCDIVINFESYNLASGTEEMTNHSSSTETFSRLKGQPLKKINALEIFVTSCERNLQKSILMYCNRL